MKLFTKEIMTKLESAGHQNMRPICKLFVPWGAATWLVTSVEDEILYGYGDLGVGIVEWGGLFSIQEIESLRGPFGLKVERDLHFKDDVTVNYLDLTSLAGI